jgi:hypothetical protein
MVAIALTVTAFVTVVWGDDGHGHDHGGDSAVDVRDSSSAIGIGGADYDIAQGTCRYHSGGFTVAIALQDELCEGLRMIQMGMIKAGVRHICVRSDIRKTYQTEQDCLDEVGDIYTPPDTVVMQETPDDDEEHYAEQIQEQQTYLGELESRLDKLASQRQANAVLGRQFAADAERRAKAREALEEKQ